MNTMNTAMARARLIAGAFFVLIAQFSIILPVAAQNAAWDETARAWEVSARRFQTMGDTIAARSAWAQAAIAWERDGALRARTAVEGPPRINEFEKEIESITAELSSWRRTAIAWREAAAIWSGSDTGAAQMASERAKAAIRKIAEREARLEVLSAQLAERRGTLIDMPVSGELQLELIERWVEVANSWEATARTWDRSGEPGKARIARMKSEDAKARVREINPQLDDAWFRERFQGAAAVETVPAIAVQPPPIEEEPAVVIEVPELPAPVALPPDWLLTKEEREFVRSSRLWRQTAKTWRTTAFSRSASGEPEEATMAVAKMTESIRRALEFENSVRKSYAAREAEISTQIAVALGEAPRTADQVLAALDADGVSAPLPPIVTGDAVALVPPALPGAELAQARRGFFDLEIGGPLPSTLTIRGRKVVDFSYSVTHFLTENALRAGGNTQSTFNLNQELQVEVLGRVGKETTDHINIDIRYDDTQRGVNSVNNRSINVDFVGVPHKASWGTYQYDADFGDISVNLPGSEFAFYNKSLFGATANLAITDFNLGPLKADRIGLILIGSQTKGVSASKEFSFNGARIVEDLKDAGFAKDKFFNIEPDAAKWPIQQVIVYKDDGINNPDNNQGTLSFTAAGSGAAAGFVHAGNWKILIAGTDYILDQNTAELEMISGLSPNDQLSVAYINRAGEQFGSVLPTRLIRVATDSSTARAAFRAHELRNRFLLQTRRIKKNDPGFVFEIRDKLGLTQTSEVTGIPTTYLRLFGFDRDGDDKLDIELLDYDNGMIKPVDTAPFMRTGNSAVDNPNVYTKNEVTDVDHKYTIHIEYLSDQPPELFQLGFDIIKGSDIVYVDGVRVTRDVDYFIDYEVGSVIFLNKALITPSSKVRIDYEFLPFGGQFERSLLGTRLDVNINPKLSFGTTLLYDFSAAATEIPSIFEDKPNQNAILEFDARLQLASLLFDFLDRDGSSPRLASLRQNFRLDLGGEFGWATRNPNTFGTTMVEDYEDIENVVSANFGRTSWAPASPPRTNAQLSVGADRRGQIALTIRDNFGHRTLAQVEPGERQQSLQMDLSFAAGETWVAIRQPLSSGAISFSDITTMEVFFSGLPQNVRVFVDAGVISEDADADGLLDSEDNGLDGVPNTNDAGERNGVLNNSEDVGIRLGYPHRTDVYGGNDGALTTEDMDGDFTLDQNEDFFRIGELKSNAEIESKTIVGLDNSSWLLFRAPWRLGQSVGAADSAVIKHLRLVFVRTDGADTAFTVLSDAINFRGNLFRGSTDSKIVLIPRNTQNDPNYIRPVRTEIQSTEISPKEQALGLRWSLSPDDSATVVQPVRKIDLGDYRRLSFFLAGDGRGETLSLFLVSDASNHIEIQKRIATGSDIGGLIGVPAAPVWQKVDISLDDIRTATINNILASGETTVRLVYPEHTVIITGRPLQGQSPSLSNINELWLRIRNHGLTGDSGEIWVNDFYAADVVDASSFAHKASFATGWGDIFSLSGSWRDVPGKFRGVGFINNPQGGTFEEISTVSRSLSATLALHRLLPSSWQLILPVTANWSRATTTVDPDRVENTLKSTLGKTQTENQSYTASIQLWKLPTVNLNYGRGTTAVDYRLEDQTSLTSNLGANTAYSYVFPQKLFGVVPTGRFLSVSTSYAFAQGRNKAQYAATSGLRPINSRTATQNASFAVTSTPFGPLTISYNFGMGFLDQRTLNVTEGIRGITNRNHTTNATLSLPTKFGFSPGVSFSGNYGEGFNRATGGGRNKDLSLGGQFLINVGVDPSAWTRLLSFLTVRYSYSLSANASYRGLNTGAGIGDVFGDYVGERLFPWGSSKRIGIGTEGVTAHRGSGSTNIVHNVGGDIRTFRWLNTSYSTSITRNEAASLSTLSITDGLSATLNTRMDVNQAFPNSWIKFRSSYLTGAISYGRNEDAASRSNSLAPNINWNTQWTDALNVTFSMGYNRSTNAPHVAASAKTISQAMNPSLAFTYYFDLPVPEALKLPGFGTLSTLNRRVQLSGGTNANFSKTERDKKTTAERNSYGLNLSLGYRIASNLEVSASSTGSWTEDKLEDLNDQFTVGASGRVEWRF